MQDQGRPARHRVSRSGEAGGQRRLMVKWKIFLWGCPEKNIKDKPQCNILRWNFAAF